MTHPHHQPPLLSPNLSNQTSSAAHHHFNQQQHPPPPPPPPPPPAGDGRAHVRSAAGETWSDPTLAQWPEKDFRLFVGNLAKDLKQNHLEQAFSKYPSFHMARIMYDKATGKSRGYGFVSLLDPKDCARAIREMDQSWLGSRPLKVKLSEWKDREWKEVVKKRGRDDKRKKKHFGL
jgi:RNA recognition motif-containing protein